MKNVNYIQWLETQIVKAEELGGMYLEIWTFRQCLKKARELGQEFLISDVSNQRELLLAYTKQLKKQGTLTKEQDDNKLINKFLSQYLRLTH